MAAAPDLGPLEESLEWPSSCRRNHYTNFKALWMRVYQNLSIIMKEKLLCYFVLFFNFNFFFLITTVLGEQKVLRWMSLGADLP